MLVEICPTCGDRSTHVAHCICGQRLRYSQRDNATCGSVPRDGQGEPCTKRPDHTDLCSWVKP